MEDVLCTQEEFSLSAGETLDQIAFIHQDSTSAKHMVKLLVEVLLD